VISDDQTPIANLKRAVAAFSKERDWDQFHSPKNLSMALVVEAAELLELFQWKTEEQSWAARSEAEFQERTREELADIVVFVLILCNRLEIDLATAVTDKLKKNSAKYPVALAKGSAAKYTELR
jgi:NTP pyrophosphatase (non-canonical NTP hydrolase)